MIENGLRIMMRGLFAPLVIFVISGFIGGCGKGIEPLPDNSFVIGQTGFSGKVTFAGNWPAGIKRTHIVVFKEPIYTSSDFFPPNLSFVIDSIPYASRQFVYNSVDNNFFPSLFTLSPGTYQYVVVAQSATPALSLDRKDWTVVGVYYSDNVTSVPGVMTVLQGRMTTGINITVDFNNLPPQPPGD
jgi:hypothetical protein